MKLFTGICYLALPGSDAGYLSSYLHFRPGFKLDAKTVKELGANYDESLDIFDSISKDQPNGKSFTFSSPKPRKHATEYVGLLPRYVHRCLVITAGKRRRGHANQILNLAWLHLLPHSNTE